MDSGERWVDSRTRRGLLAAVAGLVVAGCTGGNGGDSGPSTAASAATTGSTTTPSVETTASRATSATPAPVAGSHRERLAAYLADSGVDVRELSTDGTTVVLDYVASTDAYAELGSEIGTIAGGFLREVEGGWDVARMEATILDGDGSPRATWHVESEWVFAYRNGELTGRELSTRILETLERAG